MKKLTLEQLTLALRDCWSEKTCAPIWQDSWEKTDPSYGQSDVTTLLIHRIFGGEICYCMHLDHYWNRPPLQDATLTEIDLARTHWGENQKLICLDRTVSEEYMLADSHRRGMQLEERYEILKQRLETYIKEHAPVSENTSYNFQ